MYVRFHPLLKRQEGEEYLVGRPETNSFLYLPPEGVALIELLEQGLTAGEAAAAFQERYGERVDVAEFLEGLAEAGFIAALDDPTGTQPGQAGDPPPSSAGQAPRGHFAGISQGVAARFYTRPLLWCYGLYVAGGILLMLFKPGYLPRSIDQLWHPWVMLSVLTMLLCGWAQAFLHEFSHLLAARAKGVQARMSISRRLITPVAVTDITGLYVVPPRERYLPYLAGMLTDGLIMSTCFYLLALSDGGILPLGEMAYRFVKGLIALSAVILLWQFQLHLRTDIYFVLANLFGARNLHTDTLRYLQNLLDRLHRRSPRHDLSGLPQREQRVIRLYAPILLVGLAIYWSVGFLYMYLPFLITTVRNSYHRIAAGWEADPWAFGDAVFFLAVALFQVSVLAVVIIRERIGGRQRRGAAERG